MTCALGRQNGRVIRIDSVTQQTVQRPFHIEGIIISPAACVFFDLSHALVHIALGHFLERFFMPASRAAIQAIAGSAIGRRGDPRKIDFARSENENREQGSYISYIHKTDRAL